MNDKAIYFVNACYYKESNEYNSTIYKLIRIGDSTLRYGWIDIRNDMKSGIGTCTDDKFFTNSETEAIMNVLKFKDEEFVLMMGTLEEALETEKKLLDILNLKYEK